MKIALVFLLGFVVSFFMICGGSVLFHYELDGLAVFLGSLAVGAITAFSADNN